MKKFAFLFFSLISMAVWSDTTAPFLTSNYQPVKPNDRDSIEFVAEARDPSGIQKIEIIVNARVVKECKFVTKCNYNGGPYPVGQVAYAANAVDNAGNKKFIGYFYIQINKTQVANKKVQVTVQVLDGGNGKQIADVRVDFKNMDTGNKGWRKTNGNGKTTYWVTPGTNLSMTPQVSGYHFGKYNFTVKKESKYYLKGTKIAQTTPPCTVLGKVIGEIELAKSIIVYTANSANVIAESKIKPSGDYYFSNLPFQKIRVLLSVYGKLSPDVEPYVYDLNCSAGKQFKDKNFLLKGVGEG